MLDINKIYNMDCLKGLRLLDDNSINCCVTSPPYWGLRDYGVEGQIGLEETPEEYVVKMVEIFREVRRVLRDDGTLWLNLGDSYAGSGKSAANYPGDYPKQNSNTGSLTVKGTGGYVPEGLKPKDLVGIPWRVAFALQADGWYLRSDIIWHKPNTMPESVTDRPTKAHEYIFLLSKSGRYFYDHEAIKEPCVENSDVEYRKKLRASKNYNVKEPYKNNTPYKNHKNLKYDGQTPNTMHLRREQGLKDTEYMFRNKRSVWTVVTKPFKEAHFAVFPPKLIEPCILAGCPIDGIVLDPFMGSATTAMVALQNQRNYIGFEINSEYIEIAEKTRLSNVQIKMSII